MNKKIQENSSAATTSAGNIAVLTNPLNYHKPITRSSESQKSTKYSNTPNLTIFGNQGSNSVDR
jgi:hypothetical protein